MSGYPQPQGGASLLLAFKSQKNSVLLIGKNTVAATRTFAALDSHFSVLLLAQNATQEACPEIKHRINQGQLTVLDWDTSYSEDASFASAVESILNAHLDICLVCIADTSIREGDQRRTFTSAEQIFQVCRRLRVPVNVTDVPELCTFTFPTTHRFQDPETGTSTSLQVSVTTNGKGCRLGGRLKRDIVSRLPKGVGTAVDKIGRLRELAQSSSTPEHENETSLPYVRVANSPTPNEPVDPYSGDASSIEKRKTRMRWVAQISEFWQIERLAAMSPTEMDALLLDQLDTAESSLSNKNVNDQVESHHGLEINNPSIDRRGRIYLLGSGIGHPSLLTVAAQEILTQRASLVLSDKLVPSAVLKIIPKATRVVIARKFPGNADEAQSELMVQAVEAASKGETVVRVCRFAVFSFRDHLSNITIVETR